MKLYDYDDPGKSKSLAALISITAIVAVIVIVVFVNRDSLVSDRTSTNSSLSARISELEASSVSLSFIETDTAHYTVSDLDFFDMYKETGSSTSTGISEPVDPGEEPETVVEDETNDGKHTLVKNDDGSEEWVAISQFFPKHEYDFTNLVNQSGKMKYFEGDKCVSSYGVEVSKDQGYVDFNKVRKSGATFVMLRVGARGYQTGQITIDDYFADNLKRATDAGLNVGVYFLSQAINEEEALEEATAVIGAIGEYRLQYPIAYVMQYAKGDHARVEEVTRQKKTDIARVFLGTVKENGFIPILYGTKSWLIKNVDLTFLINDYDTWLSQPDRDMPDYPYKFTMWRYSTDGTVDGIAGPVNMDICFVDYSLK